MQRSQHRDTEAQRENPQSKSLTEKIIGAAIEVHKVLGPGLLESAYEECLCRELSICGLKFRRQVPLAIEYKGIKLDVAYRLDIVVEDQVVLELKAVEKLMLVHQAQVLTYLRLTGYQVGLLLNFSEPVLKTGIKRISL